MTYRSWQTQCAYHIISVNFPVTYTLLFCLPDLVYLFKFLPQWALAVNQCMKQRSVTPLLCLVSQISLLVTVVYIHE